LKLNRDANKFGVDFNQAPLAHLVELKQEHPVELKQPPLEHVIEVNQAPQQMISAFDEIYSASVKPREDEALWKQTVYEAYRASNISGSFQLLDRVRFIKKISAVNLEPSFRPGVFSLVNLVSHDVPYATCEKWLSILLIILGELLGIYIIIGIVITVYLTTDRISVEFLAIWVSIQSAFILHLYVKLIRNYRSYGVTWVDYVRARYIISVHAGILKSLDY
jgi:hypothetical protein